MANKVQSFVAVDVGSKAHLICEVSAYPPPFISWQLGSNVLTDDKKFTIHTVPRTGDTYKSVLTIRNVRKEDMTNYNCQASNTEGSRQIDVTLQPKGVPHLPHAVKALESGPNWILLTWVPGFNGGYRSTKFSVVRTSDTRDTPIPFDCRSSVPCNITNLPRGSTEFFKVKAYNQAGESQFSKSVRASTLVGIDDFPLADDISYDAGSRVVTFNPVSSDLTLVAMVDVQDSLGGWHRHEGTEDVTELSYISLPEDLGEVADIEVRFCLLANTTNCGPAIAADKGKWQLKMLAK